MKNSKFPAFKMNKLPTSIAVFYCAAFGQKKVWTRQAKLSEVIKEIATGISLISKIYGRKKETSSTYTIRSMNE
jgi:hypothetical protein